MKKKLAINAMYQVSFQLLKVILPLVTIPIVAHALGAQGLGRYNFINSIATYFILLMSIGTSEYSIRSIALVRESRVKRSKVFWEIECLNILLGFIVLLFYCLLVTQVQDKLYYAIVGITVMSAAIDVNWFFAGMEEFKWITSISMIIKLIAFVAIVLLIHQPSDLKTYFLIQSMAIFLPNLLVWRKIFQYVQFTKIDLRTSWQHWTFSIQYFFGNAAINLYTNLNKTLLGIFVTQVAVGIYTSATQLMSIFIIMADAIDTVLLPRMTHLYSQKNSDKSLRIMEEVINIQLFLSVAAMFGLMSICGNFIPWFYGNDFLILEKIIPIIAPVVILIPLGTSLACQYLLPQNRVGEFNKSVMIPAVISVGLNFVLIPRIGIMGAVLASIIAELVVVFLRLSLIYRETSFRLDLIKIGKYILSGLVMYLVIQTTTSNLAAVAGTTILQVFVGIISYFLTTQLLGVNPCVQLLKKLLAK
ncbi:MAG: oligosaccharide flippase family protein [Enterococcus sp.]